MNSNNTPMSLDPALAKQLFADGAVLIIAGVPKGTEFGVDLCSYTVGDNFRGVKMIPPGPHYVYCASKSPYNDTAPRVGFIHYFQSKEIVVREWDAEHEELRERNIADAELEKQRIRENLQQLDRFLAAYDYRYVGLWKNLTDTVTAAEVERCKPALGVIRTNVELLSCPDSERPRGAPKTELTQQQMCATMILDEDKLLPNLTPVEGTVPRFTKLPERVPKDASPAQVSRHCMDCIAAVDELFANFTQADLLLQEIQLAFVFFLIGNSIESLSHWRKMLHLLSNTEAAVDKYKLFFMKYSEILAYQLPHLPEELMEPTERNKVYKDVRTFLVNLCHCGLNTSSERLSKKLQKALAWNFEGLLDDDPEEMPVVVEDI